MRSIVSSARFFVSSRFGEASLPKSAVRRGRLASRTVTIYIYTPYTVCSLVSAGRCTLASYQSSNVNRARGRGNDERKAVHTPNSFVPFVSPVYPARTSEPSGFRSGNEKSTRKCPERLVFFFELMKKKSRLILNARYPAGLYLGHFGSFALPGRTGSSVFSEMFRSLGHREGCFSQRAPKSSGLRECPTRIWKRPRVTIHSCPMEY